MPDLLKSALLRNYIYIIKYYNILPSYVTSENFEISHFELDAFVDVSDKEKAHEWFLEFESHSKTSMSQTKGYGLKGKQVLLQESHHYIYSNKVKKKQGNHETKHPKSSRI